MSGHDDRSEVGGSGRPLEQSCILITGGTGSLGKVLTRRLLTGEMGMPAKVIVFSRDEAKQHAMRLEYSRHRHATDEVIYRNFERILEFRIGDVRDRWSLASAMQHADVLINAAALKQVPTCEYFPYEAVRTNVTAAENIVSIIETGQASIQTVVGVSTDKACKPVNTMGMTKALQERVFVQGNLRARKTRFICVRYGNVLASRGSVIPLFHEQIRQGGPVTITTANMTRFLLSLDEAVDTVFAAIRDAGAGETYVPRVPSARMTDLAKVLIGQRPIETLITGIRPGEKIHEILVSEEEIDRVVDRGSFFAVRSLLPELADASSEISPLTKEFSSQDNLMSEPELHRLLDSRGLLHIQAEGEGELLA